MNQSIVIDNNFFTDDLYDECYNYAISKYNSNDMTFKTNNVWDNNIVLDSNIVLIHTITNHILKEKIKKYICNKLNLHECKLTKDIHFYFWTQGSHIPWHNDAGHESGLTIYLNKEWNENWGGALLYKDSNMIGGFYPKKNRAIKITGNIPHSVVPTTRNSDIRITIQVFF